MRRCFPIERWRFVAAVGKTRTCPPMSPFPSPIQPRPPWKHTPFSPNHSRSIARTKRLVRSWLLYCDPYFDTDVLTRCVPSRHSRPLFLPSTYLPTQFEIKESDVIRFGDSPRVQTIKCILFFFFFFALRCEIGKIWIVHVVNDKSNFSRYNTKRKLKCSKVRKHMCEI